jgi:ubiquinone/menaquinone biosynthesis C-methylase UbiE
MSLKKFMAAQLRQPTGWFGSLFLSRMMNRVNRQIIDSTLELLDFQPQHHVLEIGFGGGSALTRLSQRLTSGLATGVDFSAGVVRQAESRFQREIAAGRVRVLLGDVSQLPFADAAFDRAFTINTIYFWPDTLQGLGEVRRVLKDGGIAIIALRAKETMQKYSITKYGFRLFSAQDMDALLRQAGFRNVRIEQRHQGEFISEILAIGSR